MNEQLKTLENALTSLDAELVVCHRDEAIEQLLEKLQEFDHPQVAITDEELLQTLCIEKGLTEAGAEILLFPASKTEVEEWRKKLSMADAGITSAFGIAAETGSALLLSGSPDRRMVSLLPPLHCIIVEESSVTNTIDEMFQRWLKSGLTEGNAVVVSGPSRTADIEKELVLGVHGPVRVIMFVIHE